MNFSVTPIGYLETPFETVNNMPIQPSVIASSQGKAVLYDEFATGLKDLDGFSHIILLFLLHKIEGYQLEVVPFMDNVPHGVFATRSPKRPNRIGMSIKPYYSYFDNRQNVRNGWLEGKVLTAKRLKSDNRFEN